MGTTNLKVADLFAGAGGASEGARQAGLEVVYAANHNPVAVRIHQENHPGTTHDCQDLCQANFYEIPKHDMLWASPACTGFTRARGKDRKQHDTHRSTAWAVIAAAEAQLPPYLVIENVPDFEALWSLFPAWRMALESLGYHLDLHRLYARDFGLAQLRERLFIVATRGEGRGFTFKPPTPKEGRAIGDVIDWNDGPWRSITGRRKPLAPRTQRVIEDGRARFGEAFIVPYYKGSVRALSIEKPIWSIRTHDAYAVVKGDLMRMLQIPEYTRVMGFPEDYRLTGVKAEDCLLLGNAVCPPISKEFGLQIKAHAATRQSEVAA